jgi:outer membrane immunogenic protein
MKRVLLLSALFTSLPALAQSFEGAYVGLYTGYAWAKDEGTSYDQRLDVKTGWTQETNPTSLQYGVLAGYNWMLTDRWLLGLEADYEGRGNENDSNNQELNGNRSPFFSGTSGISSSGSLRARAGYMPSNDLLLFVTGGYAYAQVKREWHATIPAATSESSRNGQDGWTVGLGAEYLLSDAFSARLEYRYADFSTQKDIAVDMWIEKFNQRLTEQSVRLGAAYHF